MGISIINGVLNGISNGILSLFLQVLKISILSGAGILLLFAMSPLLLKRHTVFWRYLLWAVLAIRLVLPFDISIPGQAVVISVPMGIWAGEQNGAAIHSEQEQSPAEKKLSEGTESLAEKKLPEGIQLEAEEELPEGTESVTEKMLPAENQSATEKMLPIEKQSAERSVSVKEESAVQTEELETEVFQDKNLGKENIRKKNVQTEDSRTGEPNAAETDGTKALHLILQWAAVLWAAGVTALLVWQVICYRSFCRNLEKTKSFLTNKEQLFVYTSPVISAPMLVGIRKPQILLPCREYSREQLEFILQHEFIHYRRKDLWVKLLLTAAGTVHWFNPLVGLMAGQAVKDMELLCDSDVVKDFTKEEKKRYGQTLLACAANGGRAHILCTSEFSKDGNMLKERFANIFSAGKKRGLLAAAFGIGILLAVSLFVAFATSEDGLSKDGFMENPAGEDGEGMKSEKHMGGKINERIQAGAFVQNEKLSKLSGFVAEKMAELSSHSSSSGLRTIMGERVSFVGKRYLYQDEEGWQYYLEEDKNKESILWETASAIGPLLLTRYKGEERQVLEDLIYEDTWWECPVLFSEGRIVYKAAPAADIIGIKDPVLVSIAMDGSDRRTADTILYHVSDGLCEDDGWIYYTGWTNDNEFPKSLCRIRPDFTGGPQYVEDIPGLLCGVMDGHVFYMAAKGKKPGIWKRNLATGKELIHDKWGESAEEFCYFHAREKEYRAGELGEEEVSGCQISFGYDYDGELKVSDVPFYIDD